MEMNRLTFIVLILLAFFHQVGCSDEITTSPRLKVNPTTTFTVTTAQISAEITSTGNQEILEKGICWNTTPNPSLDDIYPPVDKLVVEGDRVSGAISVTAKFYQESSTNNDQFSIEITQLCNNTTYYVRAYAKYSQGVIYSDEVSFTTKKISDVLKVSMEKNSFGYCEPVYITLTNTSPKDTLIYSVCDNDVLGELQIDDNGWKNYGSNLCFLGDQSGGRVLLPKNTIIDNVHRILSDMCLPARGNNLVEYRIYSRAGCYEKIRTDSFQVN